MSPEQARGKPVDRRADIWAFGCVLYEMLTARRPFDGRDVSEVLGAVLRLEPDWDALPPRTPHGIRKVLDRCLSKDLGVRQRDVGDVRLDLLDVASPDERTGPATETKSSRPFAGWVPWLLAAALGMVVIGLLLRGATSTETVPTRRFALDLPWQNMPNWGDFRVRISQQGTHLAYPGSDENRTTIYLRPLDSLDAITLVSPAADPWSLLDCVSCGRRRADAGRPRNPLFELPTIARASCGAADRPSGQPGGSGTPGRLQQVARTPLTTAAFEEALRVCRPPP